MTMLAKAEPGLRRLQAPQSIYHYAALPSTPLYNHAALQTPSEPTPVSAARLILTGRGIE